MSTLETVVAVRRRGLLMVVIAAASTGLAAGYLWRFAATRSSVDLGLGALLGLLALCYGFAWSDSRTPLLVADATGLRIRLGAAWTGVPWELVDYVEVEERGRIRDGQVAVTTLGSADVLGDASHRSRLAAWLNRWLYDAPLVVPFGLTTSGSVPDMAGALEQLAGGRAPIVVHNTPGLQPAPPVDRPPNTGSAQPDGPPSATDTDDPAGNPRDVAGQPGSGRGPWEPGHNGSPAEAQPVVVPYPSTPARREEVTIALRSDEVTIGALALADSAQATTEPLPEIAELRRSSDPDTPQPAPEQHDDDASGNVSLIIDATADLSARAMQKVRRSPATGDTSHHPTPAPQDVPLAGTVIGGQLTEARNTLGLTIDELAERTRIRPYVIESIEVDDFSPCGGDFYARGHLRMLARVLGIDSAPLLETYDDSFATLPVNAKEVFEVELATGSTGMVRSGSPGANWGALIAAVLVLLLIWGVARYVTSGRGGSSPATSVTTHHVSRPASPRPTSAAVQPTHRQAQVKLTARGGDSRVVVRDRAGHIVFKGVLSQGSAKKVHGPAPLRVRAADAAVITLSVKGKKLAPLGPAGRPGHELVHAAAAH